MDQPRETDCDLRKCPRLKLSLPYRSSHGVGKLEDISILGVCFRSPEALVSGQEVELELVVPQEYTSLFGKLDSDAVKLRVDVAWCKPIEDESEYLCGGRISDVQEDQYQELLAFLFGEAAAQVKSSREELREVSVYRSLAESISDPVCVIQNERIAYANLAFCSALGEPPENLQGQLFASWISPDQVDHWRRFLGEVEEDERDEEILNLTLRNVLSERTEFEMHARKFLYKGKPALLAVLRDISVRKEFEQKLIQAEKMRALGEMAGGVAHDFNNILGGILGRTQLLLMQAQDGALRRGLEIIEKLTLDGATTVRRIQEFTRMRRDRNFVPVNLNDLIEETILLTSIRWKDETAASGISVDLKFNSKPLPLMEGNAEELREVISNLILNAVDALPQGGTITVSTSSDANNNYLTIADSGVGMPDDVLWRVFEPFFTTKQFRGSGLGLSIAYSIISRHGGEIFIDSKPDFGTTVNVVFRQAAAVKAKAGPHQDDARVSAENLDIMLVDDDEGILDSLHELLISKGHTVRSFDRGQAALDAFRDKPSQVVITDLGIPDISGWDVASEIKKASPSAKVVLITGWGVQLEDTQVQSSGIDVVLTKPFHSRDIVSALDQLVNEAAEKTS